MTTGSGNEDGGGGPRREVEAIAQLARARWYGREGGCKATVSNIHPTGRDPGGWAVHVIVRHARATVVALSGGRKSASVWAREHPASTRSSEMAFGPAAAVDADSPGLWERLEAAIEAVLAAGPATAARGEATA